MLPRHEEYGRPIPQKVSERVKTLRANALNAYERLDFKDLSHQERAARAQEDAELKERGIAGLYSPVKVKNLMSGKGTRRNTTTGGDLVTSLLTLRNQVKLYHWQTGSFARHKATDDLTAALDASIDSFVESYMGRYGRPKVSGSIKLHNFSESAARSFVAQQTTYLTKVLPKKIGKDDTDLLNLRDEILAELTKVLYLFTLA
jgi:DNA-binding ferritin-like protein